MLCVPGPSSGNSRLFPLCGSVGSRCVRVLNPGAFWGTSFPQVWLIPTFPLFLPPQGKGVSGARKKLDAAILEDRDKPYACDSEYGKPGVLAGGIHWGFHWDLGLKPPKPREFYTAWGGCF